MNTLDCWQHFRCRASACRHSCCRGWEIRIDTPTLRRYAAVEGALGAELRGSIQVDEEGSSFVLQGEEERCPFLNEKGLCRLILELGEDFLSEICREHPRFYHEVDGREEGGFGLCCEESAEAILQAKTPLRLSGGWLWRADTAALAQDRRLPLEMRLRRLAILPERDWKTLLLGLERMDSEWTAALERWSGELTEIALPLSVPLENLLVYFLFRHWTQREDAAAIPFAVLSVRLIASLQAQGCGSLRELSRLYSAEIEYSEENTAALKAAVL